MIKDSFKIAAIQASPVFMDRDATVDKVCNLIAEVANKGVRLAVFPETFIPGYPDWIWFVPAGQIALNQQLYGELIDQSVTIPSPTIDKISQAARNAGIYVSIGINERKVWRKSMRKGAIRMGGSKNFMHKPTGISTVYTGPI
jgi:predicted amidohydrolase